MKPRHRPTEAERRAAGERVLLLRVRQPVVDALEHLCAVTGDSKAALVSRLILEEEEMEMGAD